MTSYKNIISITYFNILISRTIDVSVRINAIDIIIIPLVSLSISTKGKLSILLIVNYKPITKHINCTKHNTTKIIRSSTRHLLTLLVDYIIYFSFKRICSTNNPKKLNSNHHIPYPPYHCQLQQS